MAFNHELKIQVKTFRSLVLDSGCIVFASKYEFFVISLAVSVADYLKLEISLTKMSFEKPLCILNFIIAIFTL